MPIRRDNSGKYEVVGISGLSDNERKEYIDNGVKSGIFKSNASLDEVDLNYQLDELLDRYPECLKAIPILLAVREKEIFCKDENGETLLNNVSFSLSRTDKVAVIGKSEQAITALFRILAEETEPESGTVKWGISTSRSYFPKDNSEYFNPGSFN